MFLLQKPKKEEKKIEKIRKLESGWKLKTTTQKPKTPKPKNEEETVGNVNQQ